MSLKNKKKLTPELGGAIVTLRAGGRAVFIIASSIMDYIGQPDAGVFFIITFSWVAYSFFVCSQINEM